MNAKSKKVKTMLLLTALLIAGLIVVNSCKKSEPAAPPTPSAPKETPAPSAPPATQEPIPAPEKPEETAAVTIEQTTCPVMAGAINKDIFTEYKGKKVYFCCEDCKAKFLAEPEKYIANLPQFKSPTEMQR